MSFTTTSLHPALQESSILLPAAPIGRNAGENTSGCRLTDMLRASSAGQTSPQESSILLLTPGTGRNAHGNTSGCTLTDMLRASSAGQTTPPVVRSQTSRPLSFSTTSVPSDIHVMFAGEIVRFKMVEYLSNKKEFIPRAHGAQTEESNITSCCPELDLAIKLDASRSSLIDQASVPSSANGLTRGYEALDVAPFLGNVQPYPEHFRLSPLINDVPSQLPHPTVDNAPSQLPHPVVIKSFVPSNYEAARRQAIESVSRMPTGGYSYPYGRFHEPPNADRIDPERLKMGPTSHDEKATRQRMQWEIQFIPRRIRKDAIVGREELEWFLLKKFYPSSKRRKGPKNKNAKWTSSLWNDKKLATMMNQLATKMGWLKEGTPPFTAEGIKATLDAHIWVVASEPQHGRLGVQVFPKKSIQQAP